MGRYVDEGVTVEMVGRHELGRLIDSHQQLWLAVPAALGVRDLDDLVAAEALAGSTFDLAAARALAPTFVATRAYRRCCDVVARHGFAVLTGPPEMGKTAAARMLGLVRLCQGWEVHECSDPEQLWRVFRRDRRQMFIADDAFGSTEYRADAAERWARDLDRILKHMDADHVLVWTSRPAPLHAGLRRVHRENGLQRFPRPAEVMVDATDLTDEEKALMLYRHAVAADLGGGARSVVRAQAATIVANAHLTPERIRRLVWERLANFAGGFPGAGTVAEAGSRSRSPARPRRWPRRSTLSTPSTATSWWRCWTRRRRRSRSAIWPRPSAAISRGWRSRWRRSSTGSRITSCAACRRRR